MLARWFELFLPPATKLGQGYIFTGVCDSVHMGGGVPGNGGAWSQGVYSRGDAWSWGVSAPRGCLVETPPGGLLLRAVRILLECFLVVINEHCAGQQVRSNKINSWFGADRRMRLRDHCDLFICTGCLLMQTTLWVYSIRGEGHYFWNNSPKLC